MSEANTLRDGSFRCRFCSGQGQVRTGQDGDGERVYQWRLCPYCNGTGFTGEPQPQEPPAAHSPPPESENPPPKLGPSVDELLQQFGTYKKPTPSYWLIGEQLAPNAPLPSSTTSERRPSIPPEPPIHYPTPSTSLPPPGRRRGTRLGRRLLIALAVLCAVAVAYVGLTDKDMREAHVNQIADVVDNVLNFRPDGAAAVQGDSP